MKLFTSNTDNGVPYSRLLCEGVFYTLCNRFEGGTMGLPPELASVFSLGDVTSTN